MNYKDFIDDIINTRGRYGCGEEYHERHHIIPRCIGGTDEKENLIDLYAREHFIAHKLLAKENPHNQSLQCAWWMMSNIGRENGENRRCTSEEYEEARIAFSNSQKGENNFMYGKTGYNYGKHLSDETKKKLSESHKGLKVSEEIKQKMSESTMGEKNPMYHKHHTEETRKIMSEKKIGKYNGENNPHWGKHHTEEAKQRLSQMRKGGNNPKAKKVYCKELDMFFDTIKEAQDYVGIKSGILQCCCPKYKRETAGKHPQTKEKLHWTFVNE